MMSWWLEVVTKTLKHLSETVVAHGAEGVARLSNPQDEQPS